MTNFSCHSISCLFSYLSLALQTIYYKLLEAIGHVLFYLYLLPVSQPSIRLSEIRKLCWSNDTTTSMEKLDGPLGKVGRRNCGDLKALGKVAAGRKAETKGRRGFHPKARWLWLPFKLGVLLSCLYLCLSHSASSLLLPVHLPLLWKQVQGGPWPFSTGQAQKGVKGGTWEVWDEP